MNDKHENLLRIITSQGNVNKCHNELSLYTNIKNSKTMIPSNSGNDKEKLDYTTIAGRRICTPNLKNKYFLSRISMS